MGEIIPRPDPGQPLEFDGERFTTAFGGPTAIEHWHRYLLARELARGHDVLDVACGEGYGSALLAQTARSVVGVDLSTTAVTHAQASYDRPNLRYVEGSALAIPLPDASVDMVVSFETLEHFREHDGFLQEIKRVLRPGGTLLISTPDRDNYSLTATAPNPYHQLELTTQEFLTLLGRFFAAVRCQGQRVLLGSALMGDGPAGQVPLCFERRGDAHFETSAGLARAKYRVAVASDGEPPPLPDSIYIDTDQLLFMDGPMLERIVAGGHPPRSAAQIDDLQRVLGLRDTELTGEREERQRLLAELSVAARDMERLRADSLERQRMAEDLNAYEQERRRLTAELSANQQERSRLAELLDVAEHDRQRLSAVAAEHWRLIENIRSSTSWKLTGPIRRIRRLFGPG